MDITKLSANKLLAEMAKRDAVYTASLDRVIAAGYGDVRFSDMRDMARNGDAIAAAHLALHDAMQECYFEEKRRKEYSGSLKPIKRA